MKTKTSQKATDSASTSAGIDNNNSLGFHPQRPSPHTIPSIPLHIYGMGGFRESTALVGWEREGMYKHLRKDEDFTATVNELREGDCRFWFGYSGNGYAFPVELIHDEAGLFMELVWKDEVIAYCGVATDDEKGAWTRSALENCHEKARLVDPSYPRTSRPLPRTPWMVMSFLPCRFSHTDCLQLKKAYPKLERLPPIDHWCLVNSEILTFAWMEVWGYFSLYKLRQA